MLRYQRNVNSSVFIETCQGNWTPVHIGSNVEITEILLDFRKYLLSGLVQEYRPNYSN